MERGFSSCATVVSAQCSDATVVSAWNVVSAQCSDATVVLAWNVVSAQCSDSTSRRLKAEPLHCVPAHPFSMCSLNPSLFFVCSLRKNPQVFTCSLKKVQPPEPCLFPGTKPSTEAAPSFCRHLHTSSSAAAAPSSTTCCQAPLVQCTVLFPRDSDPRRDSDPIPKTGLVTETS